MFLTQRDEINAILPTNMVTDLRTLLPLVDDAENDYLCPVLGEMLFDRLQEYYRQVVAEKGTVVAGALPAEEVTPEIELIRLCQKAAVYTALANSVGLLSVSVNEGGGMNVMETDGFQSADEKHLERFSKDAWKNGYRAVDRMLMLLEKDAKSEKPVFLDDWKQSRYFYLKRGLFFNTADQLNDYLDIQNSRQTYIQLVPHIRYCQQAYIAPALGESLMTALIQSDVDASVYPVKTEGQTDGPADTEAEGTVTPSDPTEEPSAPTEEPSVPSVPAEKPSDETIRVWDKAKELLRMSLAVFVSARKNEKQRKQLENEASLSLSQSLEYIRSHGEEFGEAFKQSPMYTPPAEVEQKPKPQRPSANYDPYDPDNAVFSPFGFGINRH